MKETTIAYSAVIAFSLATSACLPFESSADAGVSYSTQTVQWDAEVECMEGGGSGEAMEILNTDTFIVALAAGDNPLPRSEWDAFDPGRGWNKNSTRVLQFTDSCFARSPYAASDCEGDSCLDIVDVQGYTWVELSQILSIDCLPSGDACNPQKLGKGELAFIVTRKCHRITFDGEVIILSGPGGERAVMHAAADGSPPTTDVNLPEGWSLKRETLTEPLVIHPFGGDGECYYNVIRDELTQSYHQFSYAKSTYP